MNTTSEKEPEVLRCACRRRWEYTDSIEKALAAAKKKEGRRVVFVVVAPGRLPSDGEILFPDVDEL